MKSCWRTKTIKNKYIVKIYNWCLAYHKYSFEVIENGRNIGSDLKTCNSSQSWYTERLFYFTFLLTDQILFQSLFNFGKMSQNQANII